MTDEQIKSLLTAAETLAIEGDFATATVIAETIPPSNRDDAWYSLYGRIKAGVKPTLSQREPAVQAEQAPLSSKATDTVVPTVQMQKNEPIPNKPPKEEPPKQYSYSKQTASTAEVCVASQAADASTSETPEKKSEAVVQEETAPMTRKEILKSQGKKGCLRDTCNFFFVLAHFGEILTSVLLILSFFISTTSAIVALFAIPCLCYPIYFLYLSTHNKETSEHVWVDIGVMMLLAVLVSIFVSQFEGLAPAVFVVAPIPLVSGVGYGICLRNEENSYKEYLSKFYIKKFQSTK